MNRERWRTVFFLVVLLVFSLFIRIFFLSKTVNFIIVLIKKD